MYFPCFSHDFLPRPVLVGCIAWQWPCWMKPKRISPRKPWMLGEIWWNLPRLSFLNATWCTIRTEISWTYDEIWWNLVKLWVKYHVSCLESHVFRRWNPICLVRRTKKVSFNWIIGARRQGSQSCSAVPWDMMPLVPGWHFPGRCIVLPPRAVVRRYPFLGANRWRFTAIQDGSKDRRMMKDDEGCYFNPTLTIKSTQYPNDSVF